MKFDEQLDYGPRESLLIRASDSASADHARVLQMFLLYCILLHCTVLNFGIMEHITQQP